jgi:hypothetical protein
VELNEGEVLNEGEGDNGGRLSTSTESAPKSLIRRGRLATTVVALKALKPTISKDL